MWLYHVPRNQVDMGLTLWPILERMDYRAEASHETLVDNE